jgi:multimeric flavodoxin WrbA
MENFIIYGSPNKNSFTMELLKQAQGENLKSAYFYNCFEGSAKPCDGCGFCKTSEGCKFTDLNDFFENFKKAKQVVFAFPVYNGSFPAPMKSLIDRFQQFYNARFFRNKRPPIEGTRDVTLVITAGSDIDPLPLITAQLKPLFTICGCKLKSAVMLLNTDYKPIFKTQDF